MQTAERPETRLSPPPGRAETAPPQELRPLTAAAPRRVTGLGLGSVAKVSLIIYAVVGVAIVTAAVLLALASQALGLTIHIDHFARSVLNIKSLSLRPTVVAEAAALLAAVVMVIGVVLHVLGAFVYNRIADLTGGVGLHLHRDGIPAQPAEAGAPESVAV